MALRKFMERHSPMPLLVNCLGGVRLFLRSRRKLSLWLSSERCKGSIPRPACCQHDGLWHGFCPCCKRPLEISLRDTPPASGCSSSAASAADCAFVCALWGDSPEYCLGAMVMAKSLQLVGTKHDLVLLHTDDVPPAALELLSRAGWKLHLVEPIAGVGQLYNHDEPRFKGVFTKLRALGLVQYKKVALLDIDMLVLRNVDDLFDLRAPAAMARGPGSGYEHGDEIDGRDFFKGSTGNFGSWGQAWGINAGVMVWEPNHAELQQMLVEVLDSKHPSHIKGNGPEQDYVSRFWAGSWSHIGVEYNFQLHQMYFALHPDHLRAPCYWARTRFFFEAQPGNGIRIMHYSGRLKPWDCVLDPSWAKRKGPDADRDFSQAMVESFPGYWLWVRRDPEMWRKKEPVDGLVLGPDQEIHRLSWSWGDKNGSTTDNKTIANNSNGISSDSDEEMRDQCAEECEASAVDTEGEAASGLNCQDEPLHWQKQGWSLGDVVKMPENAIQATQAIVDRSIAQWLEVYQQLQADLGIANLAEKVQEAYVPPVDELGADTAARVAGREAIVDSSKQGWCDRGGWWLEAPVGGRASVLAGCAPGPFVVLSLDGSAILELRGSSAVGVHAAAVTTAGVTHHTAGSSIVAWMEQLPARAIVLIALVDAATDAAAELCAALTASFAGGFTLMPPQGCRVAVAVGEKGQKSPMQTMAAADFALATAPAGSALTNREQLP